MMTKFLLLSVWMLLFSSPLSEKTVNTNNICKGFTLYIERTPCRGTCPAYKMSIDKKGNVQYEGIRGVKNIGKFHKKLTKTQMKAIIKAFNEADFFSFEDKYDKEGLADVPSTTTTYTYNGKTKTIYQRFDIPEALVNLTSSIEKIVGDEGYLKD